jgi:tetratricopeptide (TPR) repeat protein
MNLFWVRHDQGRLNEVLEALVRAAARDQPRNTQTLYFAALAFVHSRLDHSSEAREIIDTLSANGFAAMPTTFFWLYGITLIAAACARIGDQAHAAQLYDRLRPSGHLVAHGCAATTGTVAHHLGLLATALGRHDDADRHFAEAAELNRRIGAPTWQAWTRLEWAGMLLTRGQALDTARARQLLGQVVATARELGMEEVHSRAETLFLQAQ